MKNLFITSTRHNEGKTVVTLGLTAAFARRIQNVGYIKPVGKGSVEFAGEKIDHDVALVKEACRIPSYVRDMGPVCYDGFPTAWTTPSGRDEVLEKIKAGYAKVAANKNLVIIEGTGNAAAGAAFGLSNAFLAKLLNSKVVLVASGGVGQPTDEIILNKSYYERAGIEVLGVIVNKALPNELERIDKWMRRVLEMMNIKLLGVVPYEHELARATVLNLFERFKGKALNGEAAMGQPLGRIILGAMSVHTALEQLTGTVTLICPVDREDLLVAALSAMYISGRKDFTVASIVIAGQGKISDMALRMIKRTTIPVLHVEQDAYSVLSEVHSADFKILPTDTDRINKAIQLVEGKVDLDLCLQELQAV